MIDERVTLKTDSQGYPVLLPIGGVGVELSIREDATTGITDIEIIGNKAGLRRLGEVLIGVSKAKGFHIHMDAEDENSALKIEPSGTLITVSNTEPPE